MSRVIRIAVFWFEVVRRFLVANGPQYAAGIAYFAFLAIVPFTILLVWVLAVLATANPAIMLNATEHVDELLAQLNAALPFLDGELRDQIVALAGSGRSVGVVGGLLLLVSASGVFTAIDRGVNAVLGSLHRRRVILIKLLFAGFFAGFAALMFLWQAVRNVVAGLFERAGEPLPSWMHAAELQWLVELGLMACGFVVVVKLVATVRARWRHLWLGAGLFATLSLLVRVGLDVYLQRIARFDEIYGAAAAIVGLLLWLYLAAGAMLLSCSLVERLMAADDEAVVQGD